MVVTTVYMILKNDEQTKSQFIWKEKISFFFNEIIVILLLTPGLHATHPDILGIISIVLRFNVYLASWSNEV